MWCEGRKKEGGIKKLWTMASRSTHKPTRTQSWASPQIWRKAIACAHCLVRSEMMSAITDPAGQERNLETGPHSVVKHPYPTEELDQPKEHQHQQIKYRPFPILNATATVSWNFTLLDTLLNGFNVIRYLTPHHYLRGGLYYPHFMKKCKIAED